MARQYVFTGPLRVQTAKDYDTLEGSVKAQIKKQGEGESATYTLKTNKDEETGDPAGYTYRKATKAGEDGEVTPNGDPIPHSFPEVIPLNLRSDKIGVKKDFSNLLDSRDPTQIQLELWGNRLYKTFTLTKDGQWKSDDNYISCGLLTVDKNTGTVYVYETGHDFTLKETGEDSIYWELTADTYHPMVINNELHMLSKTDAPQGMSADDKYYKDKDGDKEYYRIGDTVYVDEGTDAVLNAVNEHRSFLDLSKEVVDETGAKIECDDYFNYKLKFNESRTNDNIVFTVYDTVSKKYINDTAITSAVLTPAQDVTNTTPYFEISNNTEFTLKIKQGWNVRFLNLSNDTKYEIEEVLGRGAKYELVEIEGNAKKNGESQTETCMKILPGNTKMTGTIGEANVLYSVKYKNQPREITLNKLRIAKIWDDNLYSVNRPESVTFDILENGEKIEEITLSHDNQVSGNSHRWEIETELELTEGAVYTLREHLEEQQSSDYHYDYETESIKVTFENGELVLAEGDTDSDGALTATNHMRGSVTVTKKVVDQNGDELKTTDGYEILPDAVFTFKVYLKDGNGVDITDRTPSDEDAIWRRMLDSDGTQLRDSEGTLIEDAVINNGDTFTLKAGQSLRLLNVPAGTKYKIEEVESQIPNGFEHTGSDQYTYMDDSLTNQDKTGDDSGYFTLQSDTWDFVTVTNKYKYANLGVKKVDANDTSKVLANAKFKLCTDEAGTQTATDVNNNAFAEVTTDENGIASFTGVPDGTYYLIETEAPDDYTVAAPIKVVVDKSQVFYRQANNVMSVTGEGILYDAESNSYLLTVLEGPEEGQSVGTTDGTMPFSLNPHKQIDYLGDDGSDSDELTSAHQNDDNAKMDLYRLYLDATMKKKTTNANIIFVEDWSSSMFREDMGNGSRYANMVDALVKNNGFVDSVLQTGSGNALSVVKFSDWRRTHYSESDNQTLADGTGVLLDWTTAADTENDNNSIKASAKDNIEVTRRRHPNNDDGTQTQQGGTDYSYWTNYTAGLQMVESQIAALPEKRREYPTYVFFMSDGLPTSYGTDDRGGYIPNWVGQSHRINQWYTEPAHNNAYVWGKEVYQNLVTMNGVTGVLEATHTAIDIFKQNNPDLIINAIGFAGNMSQDINADNYAQWHKGYEGDNFPKSTIANQANYLYPTDNGILQYNSVLRYLADGSGSYAEAANGQQLADRLNELLEVKTVSEVSISDTLSDYVELYVKSPDFAVTKTTKNNDGTTTETDLTITDNGNNTYTVKDGSTVIGTIVWNPTERRVALNFADDFTYEDGDRYELSFNVEASSKAYEEYAHRGYGSERGDADTDHGSNATSSYAAGFYSNKSATVSYKYGDEPGKRTEEYPYPVIQVGTTKLEIQKTWEPQAPSGETTIRFDLYAQKPGGEKTQIMNPEMPDGSFIVRESDAWKLTIDKLNPKVLSNAATANAVYEPIIYTVEEVGSYDGYDTSYEYSTTETADKSSFTNITSRFIAEGNKHEYYVPDVTEPAAGGRVKILNKQAETEIIVKKVDAEKAKHNAEDRFLGGAVFSLVDSQDHAVAGYKVIDISSDSEIALEDNEFTVPVTGVKITGLKNGSYKLVESEAPAGYVITDNAITFTVADGNVTEWSLDGTAGAVFEIPNPKGAALPHTGGPGTNMIYLLGVTLLGLAGAGFVMKRRRREAV